MSPVSSSVDSSDTSLSDRIDEWISRQHPLLVVAQKTQLQSDQHKVVENVILSTLMCCIHLHRVVVTSYFLNIKDHIKIEEESSLYTYRRSELMSTI